MLLLAFMGVALVLQLPVLYSDRSARSAAMVTLLALLVGCAFLLWLVVTNPDPRTLG